STSPASPGTTPSRSHAGPRRHSSNGQPPSHPQHQPTRLTKPPRHDKHRPISQHPREPKSSSATPAAEAELNARTRTADTEAFAAAGAEHASGNREAIAEPAIGAPRRTPYRSHPDRPLLAGSKRTVAALARWNRGSTSMMVYIWVDISRPA